ncbi:hypothetical protein [Photobacterium aquae]|nr:hypothetical protein [Photobacterium aquae]
MRKHSGKSSIRRKRHAANNRKKVLARHRRYTVATMPCSSR